MKGNKSFYYFLHYLLFTEVFYTDVTDWIQKDTNINFLLIADITQFVPINLTIYYTETENVPLPKFRTPFDDSLK